MSPLDQNYCRELEAYLCRKNGGHLIRIVGPSFARVLAWAEQGIPATVAFRGIDRYFERRQQRALPRRRPVRIEFCEADVLDAFDAWRRAVGVTDGVAPTRPRRTLAAHLERVQTRLTTLRIEHGGSVLAEVLERALQRLAPLHGPSREARGRAREALLTELTDIDREMIDAAARLVDVATREHAEAEAAGELADYRGRMPADAFARALAAAAARRLRERLGLPVVAFE